MLFTEPQHRSMVPVDGPNTASVQVASEAQRQNLINQLGPCRTGCIELDDHILRGGGLQRGSIVGISAEDEDGFGMVLGLQVMINAVLDDHSGRTTTAHLITPQPLISVFRPLRDGMTAAMATAKALSAQQQAIESETRLDRVMLSYVFDAEGLCEVLDDLGRLSSLQHVGGHGNIDMDYDIVGDQRDKTMMLTINTPATNEAKPQSRLDLAITNTEGKAAVHEGRDGEHQPAQHPGGSSNPKTQESGDDNEHPGVIVITHFSRILTRLHAEREKTAVSRTLELLGHRLRILSRSLPSRPLIILLNSTDVYNNALDTYKFLPGTQISKPKEARLTSRLELELGPSSAQFCDSNQNLDWTICTIFASSHETHTQTVQKPSFVVEFSQLLDVHLRCTQVFSMSPNRDKTRALSRVRPATVVEVMLDTIGSPGDANGKQKSREQRWAAFDVEGARIVHVAVEEI